MWCLRMIWKFITYLLMLYHGFIVVYCALLWKWSSPYYLHKHDICIILWQVLCALRKNKKLKRMYHFEGRIECRNGYYILRNVSHAAMDTIYGGTYYARWLLLSRIVSNTTMDAWTYMSPMDPGRRDNGCVSPGQTCIIIFDIVFHRIAHFYH